MFLINQTRLLMTESHSNPNTDPKKCEVCKKKYKPAASQGRRQKYCSKRCKRKAQRLRDELRPGGPPKKGGYPRQTYINLWMRAQKEDETVPCHYCGARLTSSNWTIDHKLSRSFLKSRAEWLDESNMVISCSSCNLIKSDRSYEWALKNLKK